MQIDRLELRNFRGFEHFEIDLHPRCTVLIGENGAGKSSILDALAIAAGTLFFSFKSESLPKKRIEIGDIRRSKASREDVISLERNLPVSIRATGQVFGEAQQWESKLDTPGGFNWENSHPFDKVVRTTQSAISDGAHVSIPLVVQFGANRLWVPSRDWSDEPTSRLEGYRNSLRASATSSKRLKRWMRTREQVRALNIARRVDAGEAVDASIRDSHLQAVKETVRHCVPGTTEFYYEFAQDELRLEFSDGKILPYHALSDGYRNLIGMAADMSWRTVQLNPHFGETAPRQTAGIALIDELELHLHPRWQRLVLETLLEMFPQVQFVVATHSPQVIASAQEKWMRILRADAPTPLASGPVHGKDTNSILERVMGATARPAKIEKKLDELAWSIEEERFDDAKQQLESLRAILGDNDVEIVGASWEISIAESGAGRG